MKRPKAVGSLNEMTEDPVEEHAAKTGLEQLARAVYFEFSG